MYMGFDFTQRIRITNNTDSVLNNVVVKHDGVGSNEINEKIIQVGEKKLGDLVTLRANKECNLILEFDYNNQHKQEVIYDHVTKNPKELFEIVISIVNGEVVTSFEINNNYFDNL